MQQRSVHDKTQQEKSIQVQAETLRFQESLLNAAGLAILTTNAAGIIVTFCRTAEKLLGYAAEEVVGKVAPIIFHDANEITGRANEIFKTDGKTREPTFEDFFTTADRAQTENRNEWTCVRKDGSRFSAVVVVACLRDADANIAGFAEIIKDISHQNEVREQTILSEKKFALLAENIPGVIYLCHDDEYYTMVYLNDYIEVLTGYPANDFLTGAVKFPDLVHPEERDRIYEVIRKRHDERKSFQLRYRIRHASGSWRWINETRVAVYEEDQRTMLEGFLQDITAEKEAEENLQKMAEENLRFFNNPVNLNAVSDFKGKLHRISPSWTHTLGWKLEELNEKHIWDFIHPDDVERTRDELEYITESGAVHTFENRLACKDGSYRWLLWGLASDLQTQLIYGSAIDISVRKKSEELILNSKSNLEGITLQLQERNRRLDEFAHIISHNLRSPVNNIQALINLLDDKSEISDYKLIFDKLKNVSKNLGETMNELMDTLKAKTQPQVDLTEIRFKEVLDKVVQSLEGELIMAQASVTFDFNEAPSIRYSKPYLESIFQNLLTNAIKYKSPNRTPLIHFSAGSVDSHLELKVTDNGQGIDMDKFGDKLFGLHKTFHEHQEARGVGLFLVKTQIEALGGSIAVTSEVDKGTTFTIRFN